jgi:hypothetical protein
LHSPHGIALPEKAIDSPKDKHEAETNARCSSGAGGYHGC